MPTSVAPNGTPAHLLHGRAGTPGSTATAQLCSASISETLNEQQKSRNLVEPPATRSAERPIRNLIERRAPTSPATGRKRDSSHRARVSRTTETSVETAGVQTDERPACYCWSRGTRYPNVSASVCPRFGGRPDGNLGVDYTLPQGECRSSKRDDCQHHRPDRRRIGRHD